VNKANTMPPPHRAQSLSRPATRTPPIAIIGTNASISSAFLKIKLGWPPGFDSLSEVAAFTGSSAESKSVAVNKVNTIPPPHRAQSLSRPATRTPPIAIIGTMHQSLQPSSKIKIAKAPTRHSDPRKFPTRIRSRNPSWPRAGFPRSQSSARSINLFSLLGK